MASEPWVKVWWDWYASRSHAELSFDAFHLGPYLMSLAKASPEAPWLLSASGAPKTPLQLGRGARMTGSDAEVEARMSRALDELLDAQTLVRGPDGVTLGFTESGWAKYQASEGFFRKRRQRSRSGHASVPDPVTRKSRGDLRSQRLDTRSEEEVADATSAPAAPQPPAVEQLTLASPEPEQPKPEARPVLTFPAIGRGPSEWALTRGHLDELIRAYPALDVEAEMRRALAKVSTGAVEKKTARGYPRFVASWLDRAMTSPASRANAVPSPGRVPSSGPPAPPRPSLPATRLHARTCQCLACREQRRTSPGGAA